MHPEILTIRKSLNKAYLKVKPSRSQIELLKSNMLDLFHQINVSESEEHHKNLIAEFLKKTYYHPNHSINTKGRADLVIHNGKDSKSTVGVIIETKRPGNKAEMPSKENLNTKAVHELVLYYLRERITQKNLEVKHLIATDLHEWFVFNAQDFEKIFAKNKKLVKDFEAFEEGRLSGTTTDFFYSQIAKPLIDKLEESIPVTWFDIRDFESVVKNDSKTDDNKLIGLYKILSPEHLLKLPFTNDSNTLDKRFYNELLHIIGLEERKEKSKKLIGRKVEDSRNNGSLIENAINILRYEDCLNQLEKPTEYGANQEEQLYNVALELTISWINRILFIKLLEGQLIKYHQGDESYKFLNSKLISNYDALNKLFFHVLAVKESERLDHVKKKYGKIPYLNSSLFEPNKLEHKTIRISNLEDDFTIPILSNTVLKDSTGKKITGDINPLRYLIEFLDSYDFSSEGAEDISEENKPLINASVLGLIFEKINGYKDGSFFTPGFITMYMCRETIRRAVVQKFNDAKAWNSETLDDLYNKIEDKKEANEIINSLKIVDPAVGSGHFLVSALNEIISIKSELKILQDSKGKVLRDYHVEVINDELVITDEDGEFFEYHPKNPESRRIQETLFHEKQTIIENCLFGVDINQNSVKICRLRLWIELLKNAYYRPDSGYSELETLPNIDINIKCGNSLISRYPLDADIKKALANSKWTIDSYRLAIMSYRNAENKEEKASMRRLIDEIKSDFESEVASNDKRLLKANKLKGELSVLTGQQSLFALSKKEKADWEKKVNKITSALDKLDSELEEIKNNKIYENAFEWRFEFPEVLNDDGGFIGFDVVIGNPPYIRVQDLQHTLIDYYKQTFFVAYKRIDISILFIELGIRVLNKKGLLTFITSNQFLKAEYGRRIRDFLKGHVKLNIDYSKVSVFDGLATYVSVFLITPSHTDTTDYKLINKIEEPPDNYNHFDNSSFTDDPWEFNINQGLKKKIFSNKQSLNELANFTYGIITGLDKAFLVKKEKVKEFDLEKEITKEFIRPQNYSKFHLRSQTYSLIYPYSKDNTIIQETDLKLHFPNCYKYLSTYKTELELRKDSRTTIKEKGVPWYSLIRKVNLNNINSKKIVFYDVGGHPNFILDENQKIFGGGTSHSINLINTNIENKYLLGILNSKLMEWVIYDLCPVKMGNARKYGLDYIKKLPIPLVEEKKQLPIIELVNGILNVKQINNDSKDLELKLDNLVYELYQLTEEEIKIIEKSTN